MRIVLAIFAVLVLSVGGFCVSLSALPTEAEKSIAIDRLFVAGINFRDAWNDWAAQHNKFTISVEDKKRFNKVRKLWKEFDRLAKEAQY